MENHLSNNLSVEIKKLASYHDFGYMCAESSNPINWVCNLDKSEKNKHFNLPSHSFNLNPSIFIGDTEERKEKGGISDFSSQLKSTEKLTKISSLNKSKTKVRDCTNANIKEFKTSDDKFSKPSQSARWPNIILDTQKAEGGLTNIPSIFDSEPEDFEDVKSLPVNHRSSLYFMNAKKFKIIRKNKTINQKIIDLRYFVQKKDDNTNEMRNYACKFCSEVFSKLTSLGGHMSKNHPNRSSAYKNRRRVYRDRQIERARREYLKSLKLNK